jgi:hypothetical protein
LDPESEKASVSPIEDNDLLRKPCAVYEAFKGAVAVLVLHNVEKHLQEGSSKSGGLYANIVAAVARGLAIWLCSICNS